MKRSTADFPGPVGIMHDLGDARLVVEAQPLLGAAGEQVQMAAHRPEEALGAVEALELGGGQQPGADEVGRPLDAVDIFADPVERVEVAKAALAVLDVGLDDVAAVAHPDVPLVALGELGGDELGRGSGDDLLAEARHRQCRTAGSSPHSQRASRKAVRTVMSFLASAISCGGRADRMADLELQVPQQVQDGFGRPLLRRRPGAWRSGPSGRGR